MCEVGTHYHLHPETPLPIDQLAISPRQTAQAIIQLLTGQQNEVAQFLRPQR